MPFDNEATNWARRLLYYAQRSRFHRCALDRDDAEERLHELAQDLDRHLAADHHVVGAVMLQTEEGYDLMWTVSGGLREHRRLGDYEALSPDERERYYETSAGQADQRQALQRVMTELEAQAKHYWLRHFDPTLVPAAPREEERPTPRLAPTLPLSLRDMLITGRQL